ncbi:pirin family protein [Gallibacterium melopsittaci]|uniref:Pirin family protein n=1 Tax=Gallibacterium melopsittaci TaxID=516063 RepID=A0ABV6HXE5_9PAST
MLYIRKSAERGHANHGWLDSYHTFSFAGYYDPRFMGFSHLRVINEDRIMPSKGFGTHPHRNMEILTYVLEGTVAHKDSMGNIEELKAGECQIMSAGSGITHSEFNPSETEMLHLYQIWIEPNEMNITPRYAQKAFAEVEGATLILSPTAEANSFKVYQDMKLWRYQFKQTQQTSIPLEEKRHYWLQMIKGSAKINEQYVQAGDAIAVTNELALKIKIDNHVEFLLFDLV